MKDNIYFNLLIISLFACNQTSYEQGSKHKTSVHNISQEQNTFKESGQELIKTITISPINKGLVDSLLFFGSIHYGKEAVDSFYVFMDGKYKNIVIEKDEDGFSNYQFFMPNEKDQIFRNFNPDTYVDLVFLPLSKAPAQLSWNIVYLYNPIIKSFELADHLALDGLEYNENVKEYVQKRRDGLGRYELTRYRIRHDKDSLENYEHFYIEHDFNSKKYVRKFYIEYENFDTKLNYRDTCYVNVKDCKIKYLSCNYAIYQKLKQTWIDFYTVGNHLGSCPELDL